MNKLLIKIIGMTIVSHSLIFINEIGLWFIIPYILGWIIYDLNTVIKN